MDSANVGNADSAVQKLLDELKKVRSDLVDEILHKIEDENLTLYAKQARLEYLVHQFRRGLSQTASGQESIGPSIVGDKRTVAYSVKRIVFPAPQWSGNALPRVPLRKFFKDLLKIQQEAVRQAGLINPPVGADGAKVLTPEQDAQRKEILKLLGYCGENHYSLVSLGSMLYGFLDSLYATYGAKKLLAFTFELRSMLSQYNAHDPHSSVLAERAGLYEMRNLPAMCVAVASYLSDDEFLSLVDAAKAEKTKPASSKGQLDTLWGAISNSAITTAAGASSMQVSTGDDGIPTKAVLLVRAQEVVVNLDRTRPVTTVVKEIGTNAARVIEDGLTQAQRLLDIAQVANYNLTTGEWGSYYLLPNNEKKMREIEPLIFQKALGSAVIDEMLPPIFYLVTEYTTYLLPTRIAYGELLYGESIKPGQTIKLRITTGTTTKQSTAQSQTIFEEQSQEAQDEYQDELNKTVAAKNNITTDDQNYLNTSGSVAQNRYSDLSTDLDVEVGSGAASKALVDFSVSAGISYDTGESTDITSDRETELTQQTTTEREDSTETQTKALQKHVAKQAAKRSTNVTVATDTSTEITKQEARTEEFTNPSSVAALDIEVHRIYQEYVAVRAITNFHVAFLNGVDYTMKPISALQDMLSTYLDLSRADTRACVNAFKQLIRIAGHIRDYLDRPVEALTEDAAGFHFRKGPYHKLLGTGLTEDDLDIEPIKDRVDGIVIDVTPYRIPSAGTKTQIFVGGVALDPNAKASFKESLVRQQIENAQSTTGVEYSRVENGRAQLDTEIIKGFFEHLSKTDKIGDVERFWLDSIFKVCKDIRELFDKRKFSDYERGSKRGGDDDDPFEGAPPKKE